MPKTPIHPALGDTVCMIKALVANTHGRATISEPAVAPVAKSLFDLAPGASHECLTRVQWLRQGWAWIVGQGP
jgi:hypothetical protein